MIPAAISESQFVLTLALLMLAPLAIAGVALINNGLGRSRSAAQAFLGNVIIMAVAAIAFALIGASFSGVLGAAPSLSTSPASHGTSLASARFSSGASHRRPRPSSSPHYSNFSP